MPDPRYRVTIDDQPLAADLVALLTRLEVRESESDPTVCALRFNLSQSSDGELAPLDSGVFVAAARVGVEIEAPGGNPVHLFAGFVTHVRPHFETIESNSYLEVLAMDAAVLMNAEERVAAFPDATDADAVEQTFDRYGIAFVGQPTDAHHEEQRQLLVQRGTDWELVQRLARRNGYVCYLEPDPQTGEVTAHFKRRSLDDPPQPDLALLRDQPNLKWLDLQAALAGPVRVVGAAIDPVRKRVVRGDGTPDLEPQGEAKLGDTIEAALKSAGAFAAQAMLRDPPPLEPQLAALATGATDRALFAVEARGELDPTLYRGLLRARRPVLIKGVGRTFVGAYWVRAVRTTVEEGVIAQTFVAERNALGLTGREDFGQSAEEVPPQ